MLSFIHLSSSVFWYFYFLHFEIWLFLICLYPISSLFCSVNILPTTFKQHWEKCMLCLLALFFLTTIKTANIFSYITFFSFFSSCIIALRSTTWLLSCFTSVFSNQPLICWFFYITGFVLTFFSLHHSVLSPTLSLRFSVIIFIYVFFFWKQLFLVSNSLLQAGRIDSCNKTISYGGNYLHQFLTVLSKK